MCMCVFRCFGVYVRMRGSKYSSENPIKGDMYWFAVLFKAFWDISTDISFNVSANGRKQTNLLLFSPTFSLFLFESLLSSLSVALHQFLASFLFPFPLLSMLLQGTSFCFKLLSVCPLNTTKACTDKLSVHLGFYSFWS